jgi:predicted nucleic acid-binding protein
VLRVYLDANLFILAYEGDGAIADHARWVLAALERNERLRAVTSEITLAEVLPKPFGRGDRALTLLFQDVVRDGSGIAVPAVNRAILVASARLRATRLGLKLPDAIHCATALATGCAAMVTADKRMPADLGFTLFDIGPRTADDLGMLAR